MFFKTSNIFIADLNDILCVKLHDPKPKSSDWSNRIQVLEILYRNGSSCEFVFDDTYEESLAKETFEKICELFTNMENEKNNEIRELDAQAALNSAILVPY